MGERPAMTTSCRFCTSPEDSGYADRHRLTHETFRILHDEATNGSATPQIGRCPYWRVGCNGHHMLCHEIGNRHGSFGRQRRSRFAQQISSGTASKEGGSTTMRFSTCAMPGASAAARSADSRCNQVPTVPLKIALSPDTLTVM